MRRLLLPACAALLGCGPQPVRATLDCSTWKVPADVDFELPFRAGGLRGCDQEVSVAQEGRELRVAFFDDGSFVLGFGAPAADCRLLVPVTALPPGPLEVVVNDEPHRTLEVVPGATVCARE